MYGQSSTTRTSDQAPVCGTSLATISGERGCRTTPATSHTDLCASSPSSKFSQVPSLRGFLLSLTLWRNKADVVSAVPSVFELAFLIVGRKCDINNSCKFSRNAQKLHEHLLLKQQTEHRGISLSLHGLVRFLLIQVNSFKDKSSISLEHKSLKHFSLTCSFVTLTFGS